MSLHTTEQIRPDRPVRSCADRRRALTLVALAITAGALSVSAGVLSAQRPSAFPALAAETATLAIPQITAAPTLDNIMAEQWPAAGRVEGFRQRIPGDGTPESGRTVAFLAHDARNLYVAFRCETLANTLRARMAPREDIDDDDRVSLYLDTFRNQQRAWVFSSNAFGVQQDALLAEGQEADNSFDAVWHTDAKRTEFGFVVLMTVPFSSLRFSDGDVQTWGLTLGRVSPGLSEEVYWPYVTNRVEGFTNQMATASLAGVLTSRNLLFVPYGAISELRSLDASQPAFGRDSDRRVGVDAKAVVRAFTVDASINPDFSQVTPDEPQVTINQRFELFFPERRPFFMENADYFAVPDELFFSRRVRDPRGGVRVTGRLGAWTIGGLGASDRTNTGGDDPDGDSGHTGIGVLRVQRDIGRQSRLSLFGTSRRGSSGDNLVVGSDARIKLSPTWVFTGLGALSTTRADASSADASSADDNVRSHGTDLYGALVRSGRGFNYTLSYLDRSPAFDAQLGYVQRVDIREIEQEVRYAWYPASSWLRTIEPVMTSSRNWDHQGRPLDWYLTPALNLGLFNALDVQLYRTQEAETYEGVLFRQHSTSVELHDAHLSWLGINGAFSRGRTVNFEPAVGTPPFLASGTDASFGLTWRPLHQLRLEETYYFTRLAMADGARVFDNHLARTKVSMQFTRALSARAIVDYASVVADGQYTSQPTGKRLTGDVLVTYQLDPFTAIHAGYTDQLENVAIEDRPFATLSRTRSARTSTERQLFIKASFSLRL
ncbi:MAG: hypothetical protein RLZZ97_1905 [Gemmatimonadota bacterium]